MLNQRINAARQVANELLPAEAELDNAIIHASRTAIAVIEGRRMAKLPLDTGHEGLALMSRATVKLIDARGDMMAAHVALRATKDEIGLRAVSFGDIHESPDKPQAELLPGAANVA
jgi:hypothetical protein